jgi:hypothetical protein
MKLLVIPLSTSEDEDFNNTVFHAIPLRVSGEHADEAPVLAGMHVA